MKKIAVLFIFIFIVIEGYSQANSKTKLKVFIDCSNTGCDQTFIRTEINMVDFLLDRVASDVHVLITSQDTGSGGDQFQLIFFGQNAFKNHRDTLRFSTDPNVTDFEEREQLLLYLKLGLAPLVAKTNQASRISISMKTDEADDLDEETSKDKWNYWVYRVGGNGSINMDQVYKSLSLRGSLSAVRITDKYKTRFNLRSGVTENSYEYEDDGGNLVVEKVENENYEFENLMVWSIDDRWSYGYELNFENSTFSNYRAKAIFLPQIEFAFFPYKELNSKYLTLRYGIGLQSNHYYDSTIYNKNNEFLTGQQVAVTLGLNQKWGTVNAQLSWRNYFHDWSVNNLGISTGMDVRITGGLSFYVYLFGGVIHDQLNLKKGGASETEVLTRRRQLASSFEFNTFFGLNYRFGSKLNNFVNPRFEGPDW